MRARRSGKSQWLQLLLLLAFGIGVGYWLFAPPRLGEFPIPAGPEAIARGEYLSWAGGCISCHANPDDEQTLSGGLALESDYGTFYVPNITPDPATGVGNWTGKDFVSALKHGRNPQGGFYFPAFPYRSYAGMSEADVLDLAAYLMSLPPVSRRAPDHDLDDLQGWMMAGWNRLADLLDPQPVPPGDPQLARGAYLARSLGHCGQCHTPRNGLGVPDPAREFAGAVLGDSEANPIDAAALEGWSEEDFAFFLFLGIKPDGEFVGGEMESVVEHNTSKLTEEDRKALAAFFVRGQG